MPIPLLHQTHSVMTNESVILKNTGSSSKLCLSCVLLDTLSQLHLHPVHGDAPQQGVLLWKQPDEGPDRADAAQLWDAAGTYLHAATWPLRPATQSVRGQLPVSILTVGWTGLQTKLFCVFHLFLNCAFFILSLCSVQHLAYCNSSVYVFISWLHPTHAIHQYANG